MIQSPYMDNLRALVDKGIEYEDYFIETYFALLKDEGGMAYFAERQDEARKIIDRMILESQGHRVDLEKVKQNMDKIKPV